MQPTTKDEIHNRGLGFALRMIGQADFLAQADRMTLQATIYELQIAVDALSTNESVSSIDREFLSDLKEAAKRQQERRKARCDATGTLFVCPEL